MEDVIRRKCAEAASYFLPPFKAKNDLRQLWHTRDKKMGYKKDRLGENSIVREDVQHRIDHDIRLGH